MQDFASFSIIGIVVGQPTWIQSKSASGDMLELKIQVTRQGGSGRTYQDVIPVRFRRDAQRAAQNLNAGIPVCICGSIGGREYNGKIYTNMNAETYTILSAPCPSTPRPAVPPIPQVTDADVSGPVPRQDDFDIF